jgi:flavin-binding protein dodecin
MANLVKVIEVIAQSTKGFNDAARQAVAEAGKTLHGIKSIWIHNLKGVVENGKIVEYRANAKISFVLDDKR